MFYIFHFTFHMLIFIFSAFIFFDSIFMIMIFGQTRARKSGNENGPEHLAKKWSGNVGQQMVRKMFSGFRRRVYTNISRRSFVHF